MKIPEPNRGRKSVYHLQLMKVNEEKVIEKTNYPAVSALRKYWESRTGFKYVVRKSQEEDGVFRIWRVS